MADRYWVGGSGTWNSTSTTNWSTTSGGAGGASAPTYADNVIFDSLSSATAYTVTYGTGFTGTASISGTTLTVTAATGTLTVGASINQTQNSPASVGASGYYRGGTYIVNQLTGTTGGIGTYTVSVSQTKASSSVGAMPSCADITISGPLTGAVTFSGGNGMRPSIYGSMTILANSSTLIFSGGAEYVFCASTTGKTIATNGVSLGIGSSNCLTFDGDGGWTLASSFTNGFTSTALACRLLSGSFDTGNFAFTTPTFQSTSSFTRSITLGSSAVSITAPNIEVWNVTNTGLTLSAGTSTITLSSFNAQFTGGGLTYNNLSFTNAGSVKQGINGANTFNNLTLATRNGDGVGWMLFGADQTITGAFTMGTPASTNVNLRRFLKSTVEGTQRTITVASVPTFACADFKDIVIAGAASPISGTSFGNAGNNSGITFSTPKTVYWNNTAAGGLWGNITVASWATTPGGTPALANLPLAQDTAVIGEAGLNSGGTITNKNSTSAYLMGNVDISTRTSPMTLAFQNISNYPIFYGSLLLNSAVTLTGVTVRTGTASDSIVISDSALGNVVVSITATDSLSITGTAENTPFRFVLTANGILTGATAMDTPFLAKLDVLLSNLIVTGPSFVGQVSKIDVYNLLMNAILTGQSRVLPQSFTRTVYQAQDFDTDRVSYTEAEKTRSASVT